MIFTRKKSQPVLPLQLCSRWHPIIEEPRPSFEGTGKVITYAEYLQEHVQSIDGGQAGRTTEVAPMLRRMTHGSDTDARSAAVSGR